MNNIILSRLWHTMMCPATRTCRRTPLMMADDNNKITKNNKNTKGLVLCRGKWCDLHQQSLRAGVNYTHYCNTLWTGVGKSTTSTPNTEWTRWTSPLDSHSFSRIIVYLAEGSSLTSSPESIVSSLPQAASYLSRIRSSLLTPTRTGCSYVSSFYYWSLLLLLSHGICSRSLHIKAPPVVEGKVGVADDNIRTPPPLHCGPHRRGVYFWPPRRIRNYLLNYYLFFVNADATTTTTCLRSHVWLVDSELF